MSLVADIGKLLADNNLGTVGSSIFEGDMPDTPDVMIGLFEYAGEQPFLNERIDRPGLNVWVRGTVYETARGSIQSIQELLMRIGNPEDPTYFDGIVLNSTRYLRIVPAQGVTPQGRDSRNRWEFSQNFYVTKGR